MLGHMLTVHVSMCQHASAWTASRPACLQAAPELLTRTGVTEQADIYSFGILLWVRICCACHLPADKRSNCMPALPTRPQMHGAGDGDRGAAASWPAA